MSFGQYSNNRAPDKPDFKKKERLKHVFDNPAHVWAHPLGKDGSGFAQTEAWNKQKNFYFKTADDGTRILYSYRDSYPIASRFVHKKKVVFLAFSGSPYSCTTSGHISEGKRAIPHDAIRFDVANVANGTYIAGKPSASFHKSNLASIVAQITEQIEAQAKAHSFRKIDYALAIARLHTVKAKQYAKFFNVKLPILPAIPKLTAERKAKAIKYDEGQEARQNARYAAQKSRRDEQHRLDSLSREEKIVAWRAGSPVRFWGYSDYALLRVKGNNVETSQGVTVPINGLAGAGRLLRFLTACKDANRPYQRSGHTEHIGNFTVESFKPVILSKPEEGTNRETYPANPEGCAEWILVAGCHRILWSEVEAISEAVNAAYKPATSVTPE